MAWCDAMRGLGGHCWVSDTRGGSFMCGGAWYSPRRGAWSSCLYTSSGLGGVMKGGNGVVSWWDEGRVGSGVGGVDGWNRILCLYCAWITNSSLTGSSYLYCAWITNSPLCVESCTGGRRDIRTPPPSDKAAKISDFWRSTDCGTSHAYIYHSPTLSFQ